MRGSIRFILMMSLVLLPSLPAVAQTETPAKPSTLDELLKQVRRGRAEERATNERREAEFLAKKQEQQRLLREAIETAKREERRSEELEKTFSDNELQIAALEELLKNRLGNLGELFGVVRQVAGDTRGVIEASLSSAQIKGRSALLERLAQSKELPRIEELRELWFALQLEATEAGRVARFEATVVTPEGDQVKRDVVRAGVFTAVSAGKFLRYLPETGTLAELGRQPPARHRRAASKLEQATEGLVAMSIDPARGSILGLLVQTPSLLERVDQGGLIGYIIIIIAFAGLVLVIARMLILARVGRRVRLQKQSASGDPGNPLGRVLAVYEANQEMNSEALELKLDEAILKETPPLERGLTTIKVLSVIAPLLGLLGTVTGMIRTFQAITLFGTGDPKLMAGGISQALVTTVLGLVTAIPLVLLHSLVRDRSKALTQLLDEQAAGLVAERAEREGEGRVVAG